jgi:hypothetical protein
VLAADHALQVFASEHFNQRHHGWTCSGAPVHDPVSGRVLEVVDLSSPWGGSPPAQPGARDHGCPGARAVPRGCPTPQRRSAATALRRSRDEGNGFTREP